MRIAAMTDIGKIEIMERSIPMPAAGEALIKIECVGICGSDLHYFESGRLGLRVVKPPFILGHEACGIVERVGEGVVCVKPGDRVALEPGKACGCCELCRRGLYNLCKNVKFLGSPHIDGVFREYVTHDASLCFPLPKNMSAIEGAMIEPLAVGFHAAQSIGARIGMTAAITGSGCIGLMSMLALKAMGLSKVYITDIEQKRLEKALSLGASAVINAREKDVVEELMKLTDDEGCDLAIETAGTAVTTAQAIRFTKKGASIMLVGQSADGQLTLPITEAITKELTFYSIFRYRFIYPTAIEAVSTGAANVRDVVTHIYPFGDIQTAFEESLNDKANIVKSVVKVS